MFQVEETTTGLQVRMSATLSNIDDADDRVAMFLREKAQNVDQFAVRILLRESVLNAVTHGSGKDPERMVILNVETMQEFVELRVQDPGVGFDWRSHSRDHDVEVLSDGGRGIALMEIYSDEMIYNDSGNKLTLRKYYSTQTAVRE